MFKRLCLLLLLAPCSDAWSQDQGSPAAHEAVRKRLTDYIAAFNQHDAAAAAGFWTADGVSVAEETGARTVGRENLQREFAEFFEQSPNVRLSGEVTEIRSIRPDVVTVEGTTLLTTGDGEPVESAFTAILVQDNGVWLISSSQERDLPAPATPYDALKELEWFVGTWADDTESAQVKSTVRWSTRQAFLIRSFSAQFEEGEALEGTQVIGWDPAAKQIRTWTFNSDGTFGHGTISKHDDEWLVKWVHVLSDGKISTGTQVFTRVDENTLTVQVIGQTIAGEPVPAVEPVTVVRVEEAAAGSETSSGGGQ